MMKKLKTYSFGILKPFVLASCLAVASAQAASGPTNDWNAWQVKDVAFLFSNAPLFALNGHSIAAFTTNVFDNAATMNLYSETDGKVYGVGNFVLVKGDRHAVLNLQAKGSISTKGSGPNLSFTVSGEGEGAVGTKEGHADLKATFTQTSIVESGVHPFHTYQVEGTISGRLKQEGAPTLNVEDHLSIRIDTVAQPGLAYMIFDLVDLKSERIAGHSHGTNNLFGLYENHSVDMQAKGSYKRSSGALVINAVGLGDSASTVKCDITGKLGSAPADSIIDVSEVQLKGKAYGQKLNWGGIGRVREEIP